MKVAIIECFNNSNGAKNGNSTLAHIKNNKIIAKYLGCPYFISGEDLKFAIAEKWDVLLFTSSSAFADHRKIKQILENNAGARKIYITNDYKTTPHSELRKYSYETIGNFRAKDSNQKHYFLNLNALMARPPIHQTEKKYDCIYWGACRQDREEYFKEYLRRGVYLSTSAKAKKNFLDIGCTSKFLPTIDWRKSITSLFRYSLYLEDKWIHSNFHNLANRWYEAGIYNNVTFFDKDCKNTICKSEIAAVYDDFYTVGSYEELTAKIEECNKDFQTHLDRQKEWHKIDLATKESVLKSIKSIVEGATSL